MSDRYKSFFEQLNGQSMARMLEVLDYLKRMRDLPAWNLLGPYAAEAGVNVPRCKAAIMAVQCRPTQTFEAFEKEQNLPSLVPNPDQRDDIKRYFEQAPVVPLEISCITTSDGIIEGYAPFMGSLTADGISFYVSSIADMTQKVLKTMQDQSRTSYLRRLYILAHGDKDGIGIGSDQLMIINMANFSPSFQRLRPLFRGDSLVFLRGCEIGLNSAFLQRLAAQLGVPVAGGRGKENALLHINYSGAYTVCNPDGDCQTSSSRP
jgi:uncharacterized protein DUF4347